mmetsp:Transcript_5597/g.8903  ORF Transcript_5597/g.8903 Transcript_5597/m.8903 type:complete len:204 (+) Transcript_5597:609-1220(+)
MGSTAPAGRQGAWPPAGPAWPVGGLGTAASELALAERGRARPSYPPAEPLETFRLLLLGRYSRRESPMDMSLASIPISDRLACWYWSSICSMRARALWGLWRPALAGLVETGWPKPAREFTEGSGGSFCTPQAWGLPRGSIGGGLAAPIISRSSFARLPGEGFLLELLFDRFFFLGIAGPARASIAKSGSTRPASLTIFSIFV